MKTKYLIFIFISLFSSYILSAQGFNKAFDKFVAPHATWSIVELAEDNYILLGGGTDSAGFYGADILRIDHQGNIVWWKSYVAPGIKRYYAGAPSSMVLLSDSTLIAFGTVSYPDGEDNFCLYRFNLNGDTLYTKEWGNPGWEYGAFCRKSPDGNIFLGGMTKTMGISKEDFYLAKCNLYGNLFWERNYDIGSRELLFSMELNTNGDVYLAGTTYRGSSGYADPYLVKTDSSGNKIWDKIILFPQFPILPVFGSALIGLVNDLDCIVLHTFENGNGPMAPIIQKLDSSGTLIWENSSLISDMPNAYRHIHNGNGDTLIYIGLRISDAPSQSFRHLHIVRGDTSGNIFDRRIYYKTDSFGLGANSEIFSSQITSDGGLILGGQTQYYSYDHWALRLDASGCVVPNECGETPLVEMQVLEPEGKPGSIYPNPVKDVLTWKAPFPVSNTNSSTNSYSPLLVVDHGATVLNVRDEPTFRRSIIPHSEKIAPYYSYTLMDYQGRVLLTGQWEMEDSGHYSVDVSSLSSGCYFLLIRTDTGYYKAEKWFKE